MIDNPIFLALFGYALGTLQVLVLDRVNHWRAHRRDLVTLRAELRRLASLNAKFGWTAEGPVTDLVPKPPQPLPMYYELTARIDFALTDENADDNTQEGFLKLVDGCEMLRYYADRVEAERLAVRAATEILPRNQARSRALNAAANYDRTLAGVHYQILDSIRDISRRIDATPFRARLKRRFGRLPVRENPPPMQLDDPRLPLSAPTATIEAPPSRQIE